MGKPIREGGAPGPPLRIGLLTHRPLQASTTRLVESAERRGHTVQVVDYLRCHMNIATHRPSIVLGDETLDGFDAIIPRLGDHDTFFATAVVRQFEMMGVYSINESVAISRSRDKLRSLQLLARRGVGLPVTSFAHDPRATGQLIEECGGAPLVLKLLDGTQGVGVVLAETAKAAESVIEAFRGLQANILVQEFVEEAGGADVRCLVVGGKVVAAMQRQAREGEFRSNVHRGGRAEAVKITPQERAVAARAAHVMGLNLAGVDLLRSDRGPLVIEVNASPNLDVIESASGKDVASTIVKFLEDHARAGGSSRKGKP